MTIPSEITSIINRLALEIELTQQEAKQGIELARSRLNLIPEDSLTLSIFASLNNVVLFAENTKTQIYTILGNLSANETNSGEEIQEAGEDLGALLGKVLEAKIFTNRVKSRLEN